MRVDEANELFRYNAWANRVLFAAVSAVPAAEYLRDLKSSHGGIHGTLAHLVWAEALWLARWQARPNPAVPQGKDLHSLADVRARWKEIEAQRSAWLAGFTDERLDGTVKVKPTTGGEYLHTYRQMFRHLINHSSYHRGQVVTMLRQLGHTPPSTDLILFYRQ
jgi:uncharacterized damage-inducible protein DinB